MKKFLNIANAFFIIFLIIQLLPDRYSKPTYGEDIFIFLIIVEVVFLIISLTLQPGEKLTTIKDIVAIAYFMIIAWQLLTAKTAILSETLFPAPGAVIQQFVEDFQKISKGIKSSILIILEGYSLAVIFAIPLGLLGGWSKRLGNSFQYVSKFLGSIPPIVYIPYAIALLPTFRDSSVFVIFAASFWPIFSSTMAGVANIERKILDSAKALNVGSISILFQVMLPASLPQIFIGCNQGLGISFILLTSAEMIGGKTGLGFYIKYYSDFGDFTRILVGIIVLGIVVSVITLFFNRFQRRLLRWRQ
ncbi:MAG: ABC transporter permease subunit [Anaerotignum sp.]|nr:ABC transporter permease subunit [Anaerotignum sp.]